MGAPRGLADRGSGSRGSWVGFSRIVGDSPRIVARVLADRGSGSRGSRVGFEYVNELFEGSQLTESDRVSSVESVLRKLLEDQDLQVEASANSPADFRYSPTLRTAIEDALWSADTGHQGAMKELRDKSVEAIARTVLRLGLHERLKEVAG